MLAIGTATAPAAAATDDRCKGQVVIDPPLAKQKLRQLSVRDATELKADAGGDPDVSLELKIKLARGKIYNPRTGKCDEVELRAYFDALDDGKPPKPPGATQLPDFVAPTIRVDQGQTISIKLNNALDPEPNCEPADAAGMNIPHCFNTTNLHAHGLWVSPNDDSDNVFVSIKPKQTFTYRYHVSADHPAGTFWYHPHHHGATAVQVSSGMAGALIVHGKRVPTATKTGDIDTLLQHVKGGVKDAVFLLQQIPYACRHKETGAFVWSCDNEGDLGTIKFDLPGLSIKRQFDLYFADPAWGQSGRYTAVNGIVQPEFKSTAGHLERWRILHSGVRATVNLSFRPANSQMLKALADFRKLKASSQVDDDDFINEFCPDQLWHFALASDGLTRGNIVKRKVTVLQPGYREDLLVVFPKPGLYCIIDEEGRASASVNEPRRSRKFLGHVTVDGQSIGDKDLGDYLKDLLLSATQSLPADVRDLVSDDLRNDLSLARFAPHESLADVAGKRPDIGAGPKLLFERQGPQFTINGKSYDMSDESIIRLELEKKEEWEIASKAGGHPFHIHVNPFQIQKIYKAKANIDWNDWTNTSFWEDVTDTIGDDANAGEYKNMKGTWRDTIFIGEEFKIVVRMHYRKFHGDFVLHCHNLHHEDLGMMRNVRIFRPGSEDIKKALPKHHH